VLTAVVTASSNLADTDAVKQTAHGSNSIPPNFAGANANVYLSKYIPAAACGWTLPAMTNFTPYSALMGGLLIGSAASLLLWLDGRVAGVSGILSGLLPPSSGEAVWRVLFIVGLIGGVALWYTVHGHAPRARADFPGALLIVGGLLVGVGTGLAHGCTSGHGVCGLARRSPRSLVATLTFMLVAVGTTYLVRHVAGIG
jgi:uncharacterized membrane protein YedE/YeeE